MRLELKRSELRQIVAEVLEVEPDQLDCDTDLTGIETFDSVSILTLMFELDDRAGIRLAPADTRKLRYFGDIERIAGLQGIQLTD